MEDLLVNRKNSQKHCGGGGHFAGSQREKPVYILFFAFQIIQFANALAWFQARFRNQVLWSRWIYKHRSIWTVLWNLFAKIERWGHTALLSDGKKRTFPSPEHLFPKMLEGTLGRETPGTYVIILKFWTWWMVRELGSQTKEGTEKRELMGNLVPTSW